MSPERILPSAQVCGACSWCVVVEKCEVLAAPLPYQQLALSVFLILAGLVGGVVVAHSSRSLHFLMTKDVEQFIFAYWPIIYLPL